jgi:hypothetical protein
VYLQGSIVKSNANFKYIRENENNQKDESLYFLGTLDGNLIAYESAQNEVKWTADIGQPLITSMIDIKVILFIF